MKTVWFKGVKEENKEERRIQVLSAQKAFEILTKILEDKIRERDGQRNDPKCYDSPAYVALQGDASGYIRALRETISIIDIQE